MHVEKNMIALPALIMIMLSMTGMAVTQWSDEIYVEGTIHMADMALAFDNREPPICTEFHEVENRLVLGENYGGNVADSKCWYEGVIGDPLVEKWGYETIVVEIHNGYPSYQVHCVFVVRNIGTIPVTIKGYTATDPDGMLTWDSDLSALVDYQGNPVIHIWDTNLVGEQIDTYTAERAQFEFYIAAGAEEGRTYYFEIAIDYNQWEDIVP